METAAIACPVCGRSDMAVKVTSPHAPRVLPLTDAEISHAAQQVNPEPPPPAPPRPAQHSGCLVAVLIVLGIMLFFGGAFYGTYSPTCASGRVVTDPVGSFPFISSNPRCVDGDVVTQVEEEYVFPGGQIGRVLSYGGCGLFLLGIVIPIVWWFQGRAAREQWRSYQSEVNQRATKQQLSPAQIAEARARVDAAYYCSRDDGFFFPGHAHFYPRSRWAHFLFG